MNRLFSPLIPLLFIISCSGQQKQKNNNSEIMAYDSLKQYGYNIDFLRKHTEVIELKKGKSAVAVVPAWQGRVMTSTAVGEAGFSFGWINHALISAGKGLPHITPYGGEERFWLGPEGGQYSIFFRKDDEFTYENWQTPAFLDTLPFTPVSVTESSASFSHETQVENYSGTIFRIAIERNITLLGEDDVKNEAGIDLAGTNFVAYRSENILRNRGENEWTKQSGLLSVWMLGMFNPSPAVTVVIPVREGSPEESGPKVNDNYFGPIPADRLKVSGNIIYFRADGKSRGKIGIPPLRAIGTLGSFDFENNILTLLFCRLPEGVKDYVNSAWQIQDEPFSGDALNSYNDGPLEDGSIMGPFYEIETSSPAAALKPGESITHTQTTIHITGDRKLLNDIAFRSLGVSLEEIDKAFD
jgi:hypothetical protein